jgi:hypothetical protein
MTTVAQNKEFKVNFNGNKTWFLVDMHGDCYGYFPTERKAVNAFNFHSKAAGIA